jgi:hypothetical protein
MRLVRLHGGGAQHQPFDVVERNADHPPVDVVHAPAIWPTVTPAESIRRSSLTLRWSRTVLINLRL